jgi:hypothetical protein
MPGGKPAGVRCVQLTTDHRCALFGRPERPSVCATLRPSPEMCGDTRDAALSWLTAVELATAPRAARHEAAGQAGFTDPSRLVPLEPSARM